MSFQPVATAPNSFDNTSATTAKADLIAAIANAAGYLASSVDAEGRFFYCLDPDTGNVDQSEYNIVRHAGTLDVLSACDDVKAARTITATKRFLASQGRELVGIPHAWGVCNRRLQYNLGATALGAAALARSCDSPEDEQLFEQLLAFLLFSQCADGGFTCLRLSGGRPADYWSPFYEAEAAYALGVIYDLRNRKELERPLRLALSCITSRNLSFPEMLLQHWTVKAMRTAVTAGFWSDPTFALECAAAMCEYCDCVSDSHALETTGNLATKGEALWALADIFRALDRNDRADECLQRALWLNSLLLQRQFVMGFAFGGFCYSLTEGYVRMDTVQHSLTCLTEQLDRTFFVEQAESRSYRGAHMSADEPIPASRPLDGCLNSRGGSH